MAKRGRKAKSQGGKGKGSKSRKLEQESPPVEEEQGLQEEMLAAEEEKEVWDLVRNLPPSSGDDDTISCKTPDCSNAAVAIWASNLDPEEFPICFDCQQKDFPPEDIEPRPEGTTDGNRGSPEVEQRTLPSTLEQQEGGGSPEVEQQTLPSTVEQREGGGSPEIEQQTLPSTADQQKGGGSPEVEQKTLPSTADQQEGGTESEKPTKSVLSSPPLNQDASSDPTNEASVHKIQGETTSDPIDQVSVHDIQKAIQTHNPPSRASGESIKEETASDPPNEAPGKEILATTTSGPSNETSVEDIQQAIASDQPKEAPTDSQEKEEKDTMTCQAQHSGSGTTVPNDDLETLVPNLENPASCNPDEEGSQQDVPDDLETLVPAPSEEPESPASHNFDERGSQQEVENSKSDPPSEKVDAPTPPKTEQQEGSKKKAAELESDKAEQESKVADPEDDQADSDADVEEVWEVKKVLSIQELKGDRIVCSTESCKTQAAVIYVSNMAPTENWYSCLDCQADDFGGWPEIEELPISSMSEEHVTLMRTKCSKRKKIKMPSFSESNEPKESDKQQNDSSEGDPEANGSSDVDPEDTAEEAWEVKKVMSIQELNETPIVCTNEECNTQAAVIYVSTLSPTEKWYYCLDCQENDFEGWPEPGELPISSMTEEHATLMRRKCSKRKNAEMPKFPPQNSTASPGATSTSPKVSHTVTPVPQQGLPLQNSSAANVGAISTANGVTPHEAKPKNKPSAKPSKEFLAMHRKWQEQAEAMGGKDARVVVNRPEAKKLIFDLLHDAFRPMNITQIHKELKAIVPSPVLKSCLDDMALDSSGGTVFADSDDEDGENKKDTEPSPKNYEPYTGSLSFKGGKTSSVTLYYVDYKKLKNNGNGLDCEDKLKLYSELAQSQAEKEFIEASIKTAKTNTVKLLSEPTNEEATAKLETEEASFEVLQREVEAARELRVNEKTKMQLKRRIEHLGAEWRKRRRMCMDFLHVMEDYTEGTVSAKKCLKGDGQIEIDSDEVIAQTAIEFAKKKKTMATSRTGKRVVKRNSDAAGLGPPASSNFVAVKLDSQGLVTRVLVDEENE